MNAQEVRRRALAAVAKLSIFAGAMTTAGCAGTIVVESDETPSDLDPGEADPGEPEDAVIDPPEPESACFEGSASVNACCSTLLQTAFSDDHLFVDPSSATDDEKACCELALDTLDTWDWSTNPPFDTGIAYQCCNTGLFGNWEQHPSCTPWGPPMPPAMPAHFLRPTFGRRSPAPAVEVLA